MTLGLTGIALFLAIDLNRSGREQVLHQFNTTQLLLAREVAHEAATFLQECTNHVTSLARLDSVQRADPKRISEEVQLYHRAVRPMRHTTMLIVNTNGAVAFTNGRFAAVNFKGSECFEWAKQQDHQGSVLVSSWVHSGGLTNATPPGAVFVATPLFQPASNTPAPGSGQRWSGMLILTVDLAQLLAEHLAPLSPKGSPARVWIMDRDGTVLLQSEHPEMASANIFRTQAQCAQCHVSFEYARKMLEGEMGTTEYQLKNQPKKLASFVPMRFANASWVVVVNATYREVTAFVGQSYLKTLMLLGTVAGALGLTSVMVHRTDLARTRAREEAAHWQQKHLLEEQLRRAETRYRTLFEQSPDGILMLDPETLRPIEFNDAAHRQLGYSRDEFRRMSAGEHASHGTPEEANNRFAALLRSADRSFEVVQRSRNGELRVVEVIARSLALADRTVLHCIHHDITERKRAQETLASRSAQLEALHQVSLSITAEIETGVLLNTIAQKALTLFRGTSAGLWLLRPESEELERVVEAGGGATATSAFLKKGQALAGRCWEQGMPLVVADRQDLEKDVPGEGEGTWKTAVAAPLRWGDTFLGVLEIRADVVPSYQREDAALLALLATQAAIAINNAALLERVRHNESIKTTLLHDVSHRVKNNLARLLEIIRLERERAASGWQGVLADLENRLHGMELVHTMLSTSQWQPLSLGELVSQLVVGALSGSPIRERIQVSVLTPNAPLWVVPEQATALALILSELVTNSVKHAFAKRNEGRLEVRLEVESEVKARPLVRLRFRDDGPGWPEEVLRGQGHNVGLHLIQASVRSPLRGELNLRNDDGAVAEVAFRLALTA